MEEGRKEKKEIYASPDGDEFGATTEEDFRASLALVGLDLGILEPPVVAGLLPGANGAVVARGHEEVA